MSLVTAALLLGYLLPTVIAELRGHNSSGAIAALNILLGWSVLGWLAALVWSFNGNTRSRDRHLARLHRDHRD